MPFSFVLKHRSTISNNSPFPIHNFIFEFLSQPLGCISSQYWSQKSLLWISFRFHSSPLIFVHSSLHSFVLPRGAPMACSSFSSPSSCTVIQQKQPDLRPKAEMRCLNEMRSVIWTGLFHEPLIWLSLNLWEIVCVDRTTFKSILLCAMRNVLLSACTH